MPVSREVEHRNKPNKRKPIDTIHTQCFGKKQKLDNIVSVRRKINFMNNCERPAPYFPSKANDDELLNRAAQSEMMIIPTNQNQPETDKGNPTKLDILRRIKEYPELWEKNKHEKRKSKNQLNEDSKRVKITPTIIPSKNPLLQNMLKRKSKNQLNEDFKRVKITPTITSSKNPLLQNIKLLKDLKVLDTLYGMNIDRKGRWRFGLKPLKINSKNVIQIGNEKWKMTPGLFELLFHIKPQHYKKYDLEAYRQILLDTNVHKRNYNPNSQIKGTKSFKYRYIIKKLFNYIPNFLIRGRGLLKSTNFRKNIYQYWDNPNELVDRLELLLLYLQLVPVVITIKTR